MFIQIINRVGAGYMLMIEKVQEVSKTIKTLLQVYRGGKEILGGNNSIEKIVDPK
ncbi:hypothetical protein [Clostridium paridis]|uniref:hypothetical protein n=1 Tax=Clostridium paridis TaxID=2803863 RepID=UPI00192CA5C7|nr:hypothetical protein [Clostridium paridis]